MRTGSPRPFLPLCLVAMFAFAAGSVSLQRSSASETAEDSKEATMMRVHYLEIVTPDVDSTCDTLEKMHGVKFSDAVAELGNARTATLEGGGRIGVRAPMHEMERSVVRPYLRVDDLAEAMETAKAAGAQIAIESMEIPGGGKIGIYFLGGIEHGLWEE